MNSDTIVLKYYFQPVENKTNFLKYYFQPVENKELL